MSYKVFNKLHDDNLIKIKSLMRWDNFNVITHFSDIKFVSESKTRLLSDRVYIWHTSQSLRGTMVLLYMYWSWQCAVFIYWSIYWCLNCIGISSTLFIKGYLVFAKLQSHDSSDGVDSRLASAIGDVFVQGPRRRHTGDVYNGASTSSLHHTLRHNLYLSYIPINLSLKYLKMF